MSARASAALLLAAALPLAACGGEPGLREQLVGRWEQGAERVEFFADGRLLLHRMHLRALGEYAVVEPGRLVMSYGDPLPDANAGDYRAVITGDTARLCETHRPDRCMALVRAKSDWVQAPGRWVDTVPVRLAEPPGLGTATDARVTRASLMLVQLYELQKAFRDEEGRFTRDLPELGRVGWKPSITPGYSAPQVLAEGGRLCIVLRPVAAELPPLYLNPDGRVGFGETCR